MEPFPFFRRPYYYYDRGRYVNYYNTQNRANVREQTKQRQVDQDKKQTCKSSQNQEISRFNTKTNVQDDFFIEIFGIKLYFDDILIIALIFFLYNEGVKDNSLFISLILLLLS